MKICKDKQNGCAPTLIGAHLYARDGGDGLYVYCLDEDVLVNLATGRSWSRKGYDGNGHRFTDVTDQYCLKRI
jgi:hypothetical protein